MAIKGSSQRVSIIGGMEQFPKTHLCIYGNLPSFATIPPQGIIHLLCIHFTVKPQGSQDAKKYLSGLTLLDRFLFAEAVEDQEVMQLILEIIPGQEIHLAGPPQTEKEARRSPQYRHIRLDVWAKDQDNRIYDTEVQNRNTGNLPRRSRYYQGYIDTTQLKPGTVDFNRLGDIIQILIAPFDLIGDGYYRYTFRMNCMENKERLLGDGAVRIFLNTRGKNPQDVSPELVQLLHFMEHTNDPPPPGGECEKVQKLRRKIEKIKANEEVGVRFMHAWEERELDRIEAIAEDLMEELETIQKIADSLMQTDLL